MKTKKLSFNAISGVLSRSEMKKIMAGSGGSGCTSSYDCPTKTITCSSGVQKDVLGYCYSNTPGGANTCHYGGCPS